MCRDESVVEKRFGIKDEGIGICYTRTGRKFFSNPEVETELLQGLNRALTESCFWDNLNTNWVCFDCELMPWSAKAQELLKQQYAPVGVAAKKGLSTAVDVLQQARNRGIDVDNLLTRYQQRAELPDKYIQAYRQYCWSVNDINDLKLAPFHILATEGQIHTNKPHSWHMEQIVNFCQKDTLKKHILRVRNGEQVQNQEPEPFAQDMKGCVGDTFVHKHRHQDLGKYHQ